jgi:uracil phosphoribosyltransferase
MTRATYWWTNSRRARRHARIAAMPERLTVVEHPVLADRLVILRDRTTSHGAFRRALEEASAILAIEATRDLPTRDVTVETPLEPANGDRLLGEVAIVPVLRAGLGMVDGFLRLLPEARVGHLGMYRDEVDHAPVDYFERLPPGLAEAHVIVPDPMLATGGSAVHALTRLKEAGAERLRLVCLVCAPEGVAAVHDAHPDVPIWTAALDRGLDENAFIRPGLGDAGDRVFGTSG